KLVDLLRLFLPALVGVREITGRFGLNKKRKITFRRIAAHDYRINGNIDRVSAILSSDRNIHAEGIGTRRHFTEGAVEAFAQLGVAARFKPLGYVSQLPALLGVA